MTSIESTEHKTRERNESTGSNVSGSSAGLCLSFTPDLVSIGDPEDELTAQRTESFEDYFKAHTFGGAAYDNTQTKSAYRLTLGMLYQLTLSWYTFPSFRLGTQVCCFACISGGPRLGHNLGV